MEVRARRDQTGDLRAGLDDLLEVVEHEQQLALPDMPRQLFARAEGAGDLLQHELRVVQSCEPDPEDAGSKFRHELRRRLDRETRLARPPGPVKREQTRAFADACDDVRRIAGPPDERARRTGRFVLAIVFSGGKR